LVNSSLSALTLEHPLEIFAKAAGLIFQNGRLTDISVFSYKSRFDLFSSYSQQIGIVLMFPKSSYYFLNKLGNFNA